MRAWHDDEASRQPQAVLQSGRELPRNTAKWGIAAGIRRFVLISAYGADERSRFFYMRAKGKAEKKIGALGYESLQIARLPAIKSERNELRLSELFTIWLFGLLPRAGTLAENLTEKEGKRI